MEKKLTHKIGEASIQLSTNFFFSFNFDYKWEKKCLFDN